MNEQSELRNSVEQIPWAIVMPPMSLFRMQQLDLEFRLAGYGSKAVFEWPSTHFYLGYDRATALFVRLALSTEESFVIDQNFVMSWQHPSEARMELVEFGDEFDEFLDFKSSSSEPSWLEVPNNDPFYYYANFYFRITSEREGQELVAFIKAKGFGQSTELLDPKTSVGMRLSAGAVRDFRNALSPLSVNELRSVARDGGNVQRILAIIDKFIATGTRYPGEK